MCMYMHVYKYISYTHKHIVAMANVDINKINNSWVKRGRHDKDVDDAQQVVVALGSNLVNKTKTNKNKKKTKNNNGKGMRIFTYKHTHTHVIIACLCV